jgi:drug/metabolite transporter (DMT)-like permease
VAVVLAVAVVAVSSSSVLVRKMDALPLAIAAWRTLGAALVLSPALVFPRHAIARRDGAALALAGVVVAVHFWAWFSAISSTTILRATVLGSLVPAWTAAIELVVWGRAPDRRLWIGLAIALPGLALLAGDGGRGSLGGDALAILAGLLWAVVLAIQGDVRQRVGAVPTMFVECASAAAVLFAFAGATGAPLAGWPAATWALLAAAVLGPQLIGHQGFAWALRWVPPSTVATLALLEPVGASLLAAILLEERPGPTAVVGGALVLTGVALSIRSSTNVSPGCTARGVG